MRSARMPDPKDAYGDWEVLALCQLLDATMPAAAHIITKYFGEHGRELLLRGERLALGRSGCCFAVSLDERTGEYHVTCRWRVRD